MFHHETDSDVQIITMGVWFFSLNYYLTDVLSNIKCVYYRETIIYSCFAGVTHRRNHFTGRTSSCRVRNISHVQTIMVQTT